MQNDYNSLETLTEAEQQYLLSGEYIPRLSLSDLLPANPQTANELCTPQVCEELEHIYLEGGESAFMQYQQEIIDIARDMKSIRITEVRSLLNAVLKKAKQLLKTFQQEEQQEQAQKRREAAIQSCKYPDFTVDRSGNLHLQPTYANFKVMCKLHDISIQSDMIRRRMIIPSDVSGAYSLNGAERAYSLDIQDQCIREGIFTNAKQIQTWIKVASDENRINPIREYLERQAQAHPIAPEQNGAMMQEVFNCLQFDEELTTTQYEKYGNLFFKWLVQCVAMAHNEYGRYGAEFVLVLQSRQQGAGKTSFFRHLCSPPELKDYFLEGRSMNPANKDDVLENTSCWICELGELEGTTKKKEIDRLKAFLTNSSDRVRAPYDAADCTYPRLTSYAGTVNEADFLRESGRRFVVLPIVSVNLARLKQLDMNRLWVEAYLAYCTDHNAFRLNKQELQTVVADSEQFRSVFSEEQVIRDSLDWGADPADWREYSATDIAHALDLKDAARVGKALLHLGYEKTRDVNIDRRFRILDGSKKYYIPPLKRASSYTEEDA